MNRLNQSKWKSVAGIVIGVVAALALFVYLVGVYLKAPIDSDWASLALEANDILSGNLLLKDWVFTGATFLLTEIPLYLASVSVFGVSVLSVILAIALGGWLIFIAGLLLSVRDLDGKTRPVALIVYVALAVVPTAATTANFRAHIGVFVVSFLLFLTVAEMLRSATIRPLLAVIYFGLLFAASFSDAFVLPVAVAPIIAVVALRFWGNEMTGTEKRDWTILGLTVLGVLLGKIGEKAHIALIDASFNSRTESVEWVLEEKFFRTLANLFFGGTDLLGANPFGTRLFTLASVSAVLRIVFLAIGLYYLVIALRDLFWRVPDLDVVSALIALSITVQSIFVVAVGYMRNTSTALRYLSFYQFAFAILAARGFAREKGIFDRCLRGRVPVRAVLIGICAVTFLVSIVPIEFRREPTVHDRLATFLRENELTSGYADFWIASHTVVSSDNRVHLRAIIGEGLRQTLRPYRWFNRVDWYDDPTANFIVVSMTNPWQNVSEENVRATFGEPLRMLEFDEMLILVYPPGLNERLIRNSGE